MPKKFRIKVNKTKPSSKIIIPSKLKDNKTVSFSLKYLKTEKDKFNYCTCENIYFNTLLSRLRDISGMSRKEMTLRNGEGMRCHQIDFINHKVSEKSFGILQQEEAQSDAWQFELTSNKHGRVHGFFIEDTFYIVWLDPNRELYAGKFK